MKSLRKFFTIIMMGVIFLGLFSFTSCSFFNTEKDPQKFSKRQLEELEDTLDSVVADYFQEKYGVAATIESKTIAGGVFLGPDSNAQQYYYLSVDVVADDNSNTKCEVEVYGRHVDGIDELYVKSESYYGQVIKERMEAWVDGYVSETNLDKYYINFYSGTANRFPSEYDVAATVDEIIKSVSAIENNIKRPELIWYILIPESEYEKHSDIEVMFSSLQTYINEIDGKTKIELLVLADDDFLARKTGDDSRLNPIEEFIITNEN